jgi:hypothetical protein
MEATTQMTAIGAVKVGGAKANAITTTKAAVGAKSALASSGGVSLKGAVGSTAATAAQSAATAGSATVVGKAATASTLGLSGGEAGPIGASGAASVAFHSTASGTTHGTFWSSLGAHLGLLTKGSAVAVKSSLLAKSLAAAGLTLAGAVVVAHAGIAPGLQGSLSAVPSWTTGQSILGQIQAGLSGSGSAGGGIQVGL